MLFFSGSWRKKTWLYTVPPWSLHSTLLMHIFYNSNNSFGAIHFIINFIPFMVKFIHFIIKLYKGLFCRFSYPMICWILFLFFLVIFLIRLHDLWSFGSCFSWILVLWILFFMISCFLNPVSPGFLFLEYCFSCFFSLFFFSWVLFFKFVFLLFFVHWIVFL